MDPHLGFGQAATTRQSGLLGWGGAVLFILVAMPSCGHADEPVETPDVVKPASPSKPQIVAVPIPQSDPALGTGLVAVGAVLYQPKGSGGVWTTGVGVLRTSSDSWAVGIGQKARFKDDRFRVTVGVGYADLNLRFYGVGGLLASQNRYIQINQTGLGVKAEGLARIAPHAYLGAEYVLIDAKTSLINPRIGDITLPDAELDSVTSAIGLAGEYDTRNAEYGARSGIYATGAWRFASPSLGSKFKYQKFDFAANGYRPIGPNTVVAARVNLCGASNDTPFYDLCLYGSGNSLRGYATGQYRDNAMGSAQVELRQHLFWRLGGVVFAGVGGTAPGLKAYGKAQFLPDVGLGLRVLASKAYGVNLSIDVAAGRHDSSGVYIYLGEAF